MKNFNVKFLMKKRINILFNNHSYTALDKYFRILSDPELIVNLKR